MVATEFMGALLRLYTLAGVVLLASPADAQDAEQVRALSNRVAQELSTLHRYDSDITAHAGAWLGGFIHIRLSSVESPEVVFLSFTPRLLSQVSDFLRASPAQGQRGSVEFREDRFTVEACDGLSTHIESLKVALRDSMSSIGQRHDPAAPLQEIIVDGRVYELKVRVNRYFEGNFQVGENDRRLFGPLDAVVRVAAACSQQVGGQLRTHAL